MRPIITMFRGLCVRIMVTIVSPTKTDEPIESKCEGLNRLGPRNHVLDRGPNPREMKGGDLFWWVSSDR